MQVVWLFIYCGIIHACCGEGTPRRIRRMVNGRKAEIEEWAFTALLIKDKDGGFPLYCGSALISPNFVLTAAHCIDSVVKEPWKITVNIGSPDRRIMKCSKNFVYGVSQIIRYPNYKEKDIPNDDIAILRLNRSVYIKEIKISEKAIYDDKRCRYKCKAAGWGKDRSFRSITELQSESNPPSNYLMEIDVPIISRLGCIASMKDMIKKQDVLYLFVRKMICGGSINEDIGTACLYDSGSPLVCTDENGYRRLQGVAIAIHGQYIKEIPCTPGRQITIFIRVAPYADWINEIIKTPKLIPFFLF